MQVTASLQSVIKLILSHFPNESVSMRLKKNMAGQQIIIINSYLESQGAYFSFSYNTETMSIDKVPDRFMPIFRKAIDAGINKQYDIKEKKEQT